VPSSHPLPEHRRARAPFGLATLDETAITRTLVPSYVGSADYPWLSSLLFLRGTFVGRKRSAWTERLREGLAVKAPRHKLELALRVLDRLARDHIASPIPARRIRSQLFGVAAAAPNRAAALELAAAHLDVPEEALLEALFADLPPERVLSPLTEPLDPEQLALRCNAELIASLLARALRVRIEAHGNVRAVVRHAKLLGLLCRVEHSANGGIRLDLSGPFSLFRHTRLYGRALASLVPRLAWCHTYELTAECVLSSGDEVARLVVDTGAPVLYGKRLPDFDSKLEARFARSFARLTAHWELLREPTAFAVGSALVFPDFELRHRVTGESWLLEIVGFWTSDYLDKKLAALREARIDNLILCIDETRGCSEGEVPKGARLVRFKRAIDAAMVLAIIEPSRDHAEVVTS
jgi:predicted nuclease of restriction endonuclease-like RecB superfamily